MVSIIIPTYNAEKYIHRCIESVVNQTYKNLEIIIIDDGSSDTTGSICSAYAKQDSRIRLVSIENAGVSNARNIGLDLAKGQYISFIDSDDYIDNDYIEDYIKNIELMNADIVIGGFQEERDNAINVIKNKNSLIEGEGIKVLVCALLDNVSDKGNTYSPQALGFSTCKLYKRSILKTIKFDKNVSIREDTLFNVQVFLGTKKIFISDNIGYHYVINADSATGHFRKKFTEEAEIFLEKAKTIWEKNRLDINSFYMGCLYMYMRWLKLFVLNDGAGFTKREQIRFIQESFNEDIWKQGFKNVLCSSLKPQYKALKLLYDFKWAKGICTLCKLSELGR